MVNDKSVTKVDPIRPCSAASLLAWMPTDKKKPNRTLVRFHDFSAMSWDYRRLSGLSMYRFPPR